MRITKEKEEKINEILRNTRYSTYHIKTQDINSLELSSDKKNKILKILKEN